MEQRLQNQGFQSAIIQQEKDKQINSPLIIEKKGIIPDAKPILSNAHIDKSNRPKVLIKQIKITIQPPELSLSSMVPTKGVLPFVPRQQFALQKQTLYQQYILSNEYDLNYYRYSKPSQKQVTIRDLKRMFSKNYFCSYFLRLDFIREGSNYLVRNLEETSLAAQVEIPVDDIEFNSRFQCGNLFAVFEKKYSEQNTYDLILQNDINTAGYTQWFYFSIRNKQAKTIKIRIVNLSKADSLFRKGMKPAVFSYRKLQKENIGWERKGDKLQYGLTNYRREGEQKAIYSYVSFQIDLKENDITYIATTLPYSYTRLQRYINSLEQECSKIKNLKYKKDKLASTISFNACPIITLSTKRAKNEPKVKKKYVCIIGRQHPCQTVSSFVMQGIINFLITRNQLSEELFKKYIFKIVPMMNPDGVIYGNSRCDISGADINGRWSYPSKDLYPTTQACKNMLIKLSISGNQIEYFFDIHGHSKQLNSFIYGPQLMNQQMTLRLLPYIMSKLNHDFSFSSCQFGVSIWKRNTARANIMRIMKYSHRSFTIQTSAYGHGSYYNSQHFTAQRLSHIGYTLMLAFYFERFKPENNKQGIDVKKLEQDIYQLLKEKKKRTQQKDQVDETEQKSQQASKSGSDSEPSVGQLDIEEKQMIFLPHSLAQQLKQIEKIQENQKQKQLKKIKQKTLKCITKQSSKTMQRPKKVILQKLKLTNPVPFSLSEPRNKIPPQKPRKISIQKIQRTVPLSQIPMMVDLPQHPFKDIRKNKESLTETMKKLQRKSFFESIKKDIDEVLDSNKYNRYSEYSKDAIKMYKPLSTLQVIEMKSYDSVGQLHQKRLSSLVQKSKRVQKTLLQKLQRPRIYRNRSNRRL